jgi:class 3 adenylate cyclase
MTFRTRLLQIILAVVAATVAAVLVVAQSQNSASFDSMVDVIFNQQAEGFKRDQQAQTAAVEFQASLGDSVRVFAALEEGDPETYNVASDEVRLGDFDFFRLAATNGGLIAPPADSRAGLLDVEFQASLAQQLQPIASQLTSETIDTNLGFVRLPRDRIFRVLALPVRKFDHTVGQIFLGKQIKLASDTPGSHRLIPLIAVGDTILGEGVADVPKLRFEGADPSVKKLELGGQDYRIQRHVLNPGSAFPETTLISLFPLAEFQDQQHRLILRVLGIGLFALFIAALLAFAFSRQLSRPIDALVGATHEVSQGNLKVRLPSAVLQEFSSLNSAFNEMTEGLALKERYHSVLSMVTDSQVAEQLMAGKIQLGGEAREVSILFCDIRGYTAMTVGRDPAEVIRILNEHMGALTAVVYRWHGVITQFAGDAVMVVFGAPTSHGHDPENAVRCAWEMIAARADLNQNSPLPLGIGIGIASGAVVAGCIGAENRADYTVVGERVNLAARLCSAAAAGEIIVDESTRDPLPADIQLQSLDEPLQLKGFASRILAYRVTSISS